MEFRGKDVSRLAKPVGMDLHSLSNLLGEAVTMRVFATFESGGPGA